MGICFNVMDWTNTLFKIKSQQKSKNKNQSFKLIKIKCMKKAQMLECPKTLLKLLNTLAKHRDLRKIAIHQARSLPTSNFLSKLEIYIMTRLASVLLKCHMAMVICLDHRWVNRCLYVSFNLDLMTMVITVLILGMECLVMVCLLCTRNMSMTNFFAPLNIQDVFLVIMKIFTKISHILKCRTVFLCLIQGIRALMVKWIIDPWFNTTRSLLGLTHSIIWCHLHIILRALTRILILQWAVLIVYLDNPVVAKKDTKTLLTNHFTNLAIMNTIKESHRIQCCHTLTTNPQIISKKRLKEKLTKKWTTWNSKRCKVTN